jgi:hypothetical protein
MMEERVLCCVLRNPCASMEILKFKGKEREGEKEGGSTGNGVE